MITADLSQTLATITAYGCPLRQLMAWAGAQHLGFWDSKMLLASLRLDLPDNLLRSLLSDGRGGREALPSLTPQQQDQLRRAAWRGI